MLTAQGTDAPTVERVTVVRFGAPEFHEADGVAAAWFQQHACNAAIVRPDHYVWGVADGAASLASQLATLQQQLQSGDNA